MMLDSRPILFEAPVRRLVQPRFLPTCAREMHELGWTELDLLIVSGSAYVDHPAFGEALLGRLLVAQGFRVGIVAQPPWQDPEPLRVMGRPRLAVGITAGALDSMLAHRTAFRRPRTDDAYTPGNEAGKRPDRATLVYAQLARQAFPGLPILLGGVEASMRRAVHYDFFSQNIRRPYILDAKADLLLYGMAEHTLLQVLLRLEGARERHPHPDLLSGLRGTVRIANSWPQPPVGEAQAELPAFEDIVQNPGLLMKATLTLERQVLEGGPWLVQRAGSRFVQIAPPSPALEPETLDRLYALPFSREAHPSARASVPALEMVRFSLTSHRGCGGGCSFCALALHQGRIVQSRSPEGLLDEAARLSRHPAFAGSITDIGGPTANLYGARCDRPLGEGTAPCRRPSCLWPMPCPHLVSGQTAYGDLLSAAAALPGVRHVRVASGIRYDLAQGEPAFLELLLDRFCGGQLKVAPEHTEEPVLRLMRKPPIPAFERFLAAFDRHRRRTGREQYLVPYFLSAFPGCTLHHMERLAHWLGQRGWHPRQVQGFIPTPGTVATAMFVAGQDPRGHAIHVPRSDGERRKQHKILIK